MAQWFALIYKNGPQVGNARSFGTVITDPLDTTKYEAIPIAHQPRSDEIWDKTLRMVIIDPSITEKSGEREIRKRRREELKAVLTQRPWTSEERDEAIAELL